MSEPVAFIKQGDDGYPRLVKNPLHPFKYNSILNKYPDIPLHPQPMRELTDESITNFAKAFGLWNGELDYRGFARAIELFIKGDFDE